MTPNKGSSDQLQLRGCRNSDPKTWASNVFFSSSHRRRLSSWSFGFSFNSEPTNAHKPTVSLLVSLFPCFVSRVFFELCPSVSFGGRFACKFSTKEGETQERTAGNIKLYIVKVRACVLVSLWPFSGPVLGVRRWRFCHQGR